MMERLRKKYQTARQYVPKPILCATRGATVGIIGYGSTEAAITEARYQLAAQHGIQADFLRIRAIPFAQEVAEFVKKHDQIFVVEMNRDGQMHQLLKIEYPEHATHFKSVAYGDGLPASATWVRQGILSGYEAPRAGERKAAGKTKAASKPTLSKAAAPVRTRAAVSKKAPRKTSSRAMRK
jgi:2-oxoglutarate ferredoxin oxidoreductase subunit alpha